MSTVQPPPPPTTPASAPAAASSPILTVTTPPPALSALTAGTPVTALVTASQAQGSAEIETSIGKVLVETKLPLKTSQPLVLQIGQSSGKGAVILNVLEIAGRPVSSAGQSIHGSQNLAGVLSQPSQAGLPTPPGTAPASPTTPTANISLLAGTTLNATTLTPITSQLVSPNSANQTAPGLMGQQGSAAQPTAQNSPGPSINPLASSQSNPAAPNQPAGAQPTGNIPSSVPTSTGAGITSLPAGGAAGGEPRIFPIGSHFSLTIQTVQPPSASSPGILFPVSSTPFAVETIVTGQVTSQTFSGQPVIQTHYGSFALNTSNSLPVGTELTLKINSMPEPTDTAKPIQPALQRVGMMTSGTWPSLDEGLNVIQSADPSLAQQLQSAVLPKADIKLTATALFFLSAIRGGDVRGWIGDNASRLLERLRPDVMRRLSNDFRVFSETEDGADARRTTEWRGTLVPFLNGNEMEQLRLFTRYLSDENSDDENMKKAIRFIIDINLSNIGRFQLDGIAETGQRRLDMIIRTASALPDRVRSDLMTLFSEANDIVGMHGGMIFQASPNSFVEPISDTPQQDHALGIIV